MKKFIDRQQGGGDYANGKNRIKGASVQPGIQRVVLDDADVFQAGGLDLDGHGIHRRLEYVHGD